MNKVCWLAHHDDRFRQLLMVDPDRTLRRFVPALAEDERIAFLSGDVGALVAFGTNRYLLARLARRNLFGLDMETYRERLRRALESSQDVRDAMYPGLSDRPTENLGRPRNDGGSAHA
jgi:hypothetical protein